MDTKSGEVDPWPAHASGHSVPSTSLVMTKDKNLVLVSDEQLGKPNMIPKPRFLEQLEGYLMKELRALGVTQVEPNELRLQVIQMLVKVLFHHCYQFYVHVYTCHSPNRNLARAGIWLGKIGYYV